MFLDAPRGLSNPDRLAERQQMLLDEPRVRPLVEWTVGLVERRSRGGEKAVVPHFDPAEGGTETRLLLLLEAPGPMTNSGNERPGSGFISTDNNDPTAENTWRLRDEFGLSENVLHWNIVPWYLGPTAVKPNAAVVDQGALELRRLLPLLPNLEVVMTCGVPATKGWQKHVAPHMSGDLTVIETWHPSPLAMAAPGKRDGLRRACERAARLLG